MKKDFDNKIQKESLWERFSSIWADDFKNAIHILRIINSYPDLAELISKKPLQAEQTILDSQKCWIWLCSRLSNEIDTEFFKEYWVPIELDEYGIYMDLSDKLENAGILTMQSKGFRYRKKYHIEIMDVEGGEVFFENNIFLLRTINKSITNTLISNYLQVNKT